MDSDRLQNDSHSYSLPSQATVSDETVALSETLSVLSQHRNRQILLHLHRNDGPVTIDDLTAHVAALDTNTTVGNGTEPTEENI